MRRGYRRQSWRSERGSQSLEAAGAALAAALIVLALLAGARGALGPQVAQAFRCAASALIGGGDGCAGGAADTTGTPRAAQDAPKQDEGGFSLLDGLQLGLDVVGLVPGFGEVADGVNGLISLARGDNVGAALSFGAMVPFAGWGATGGKWVRTGIKYSDEAAEALKYSDEAAEAAGLLRRCASTAPPGKGPGLAKPLLGCLDVMRQRAADARQALGIGKGRNLAIADINIQGTTDELIGVSGEAVRKGTVNSPTDRFFTTIVDQFPRDFDSEAKILEEIAHRYADQPGVYRNVQGTIDLYTERPPCASCSGVIEQFQQMFPNIKVNVLYGQ